ncbi:MAG: hypothetical protein D4S01_03500 [Dehalococcoidia bacterium]|nr:MAG: hypothetical protein D4S01_03500 [Dehalococcoidia bacterium]
MTTSSERDTGKMKPMTPVVTDMVTDKLVTSSRVSVRLVAIPFNQEEMATKAYYKTICRSG